MMTYLFAGAGVLLGIQALLLWRMVRISKDLRQFDQRLAHFTDALALLTETAESGFQAVAAELSRLSASSAAAAPRRTTTRRVASAARKGKSVSEIAADEQVSEGEVRLRLQIGERAPKTKSRPHPAQSPSNAHTDNEGDHGAMRTFLL